MASRALIVLLLILNFGVAAWWIMRPLPRERAPSQGTTVPTLVLLREATPSQRARSPGAASTPDMPAAGVAGVIATATVVPATAEPAAVAATAACYTLGPFRDDAALAVARTALQRQVVRLQVRRANAGRHGWRVWMPPLADRAAADAMAARIAAAGFKDYYVMAGDGEANGIALGRFGNPAAANRQQVALATAGIAARVEEVGTPVQWIDAMAGPTLDGRAARAKTGAAQVRTLDCSQLH